jgi:hypothetical protein
VDQNPIPLPEFARHAGRFVFAAMTDKTPRLITFFGLPASWLIPCGRRPAKQAPLPAEFCEAKDQGMAGERNVDGQLTKGRKHNQIIKEGDPAPNRT